MAATRASGGVPKGAPWLLFSLRSSGHPSHCSLLRDIAPHLGHYGPLPAMCMEERAPNRTSGALGASLTSANNNHCIFLGKSLNFSGS